VETVKVRIPAGVETGSRVRIPGKGEGGRLGAPPGDLHIITNVGPHKYFTRKGDNIYATVPITVPEAALGAKIEVPTVEGKAQLRIPPGTQSGQKFRLRQRGAPSLRNPGARGDQFVEVQVTLPKVISEETKELLRQYSKMNSENPRVEMGLEWFPIAKCRLPIGSVIEQVLDQGRWFCDRRRKAKTYTISAVADQYGIHPQTLRLYEREGLLKPSRSEGNTRLYTDPDLERLELILSLTRDLGVNLAGVEIILNMREKMDAMQQEFERFFQYLQSHADELTNFVENPAEGTSDALVPLTRAAALRRRGVSRS
jgi:DNA-binding transcriptional MerR regulator